MSSWRSTIILLSPSEPRNLSWSLRVDGSNGIRKDFNHANPGGPYLAPSVAHEGFQKEGVLEPTSRPKPLRGPSRPRSLRPRTLRSSCWRVRASVNLSSTGQLPVCSLSSLLLLASPRLAP